MGWANVSTPILIGVDVDEIVNNDDLQPILLKFQKTKLTKFKMLTRLKNLVNLFKFQNVGINIRVLEFLALKTRIIFTVLKKALTKALIFEYFEPKCCIRIKMKVFDYVIDKNLN